MAEQEQATMRAAKRRSPVSSPARPSDDPPGVVAAVRSTLLLFLAICIVGAGPLVVVNGIFGVLRVDVPPLPGLSIFAPGATEAPDLALPREAWTAVQATVVTQPGGSSRVAMLEPGFPVTITAHQRAGGALWSHITWDGPTRASGGDGWAQDSAFVAYGGQGRPIGDIGAFSPHLLAAVAPQQAQFAGALYFPDSGQLYRTRADQAFPLGDGFRSVLLVTIFAWSEEQHQRVGAAVAAATAAGVAGGDPSAASIAYAAVGDATGVSTYLAKSGITGIQPAPGDWRGAQASPTGLLQIYTALATKQALSDADRATVLSLLGHVTSPVSTQMAAILPPGQDGVLVIGASQGTSGWTMSACGILVPASGSRVVLAAVVRDQPTQSAAESALVAFYSELARLLAA